MVEWRGCRTIDQRRRAYSSGMPAAATSPSTQKRILEAALEGFARDGVAATSIRDVAQAAGVSPGLVQHYFPSKRALCAAVDSHVTEIARGALEIRPVNGDLVTDIAERLTALVRDHFIAMRYLARGASEGEDAALTVFAALIELCRAQLDRFAADGLLRDDLDREWAALHTVLINLATVMLEPAVTRTLGQPFLSDTQVERWRAATTELFVRGELRQPDG